MKNLRRLTCKFDLDQSERKSSQVHASPGQTKSQVDPSLQLASPFGQGLTVADTKYDFKIINSVYLDGVHFIPCV